MSISSRITYVPAQDLLEEEEPARRIPRLAVGRGRRLAGVAVACAALTALTLLLDGSDALSLEGTVLLYLLAVLVVALVGGVVVALACAVAAGLLINYFFVAPRHTLDVAHADQALALFVFVAVAAVVSGAVEVATRRARAAELAAAQAETLSALAAAELGDQETLRDVLDRARRTFNMESVVLKVRDHETGEWDDAESAGWSSREPLRFDVPITHDLRLLGRGPALFAEDQRVLHAFAAAAQNAYEARRLSARARKAGELATIDRQRTALLAAVGHDLRTPLAGIKASVTTLRQTDVDWSAADRDELLATIEQSADRLDGIVANLLDASRLQAGAVPVRLERIALDQVIGAALLALPGAAETVTLDVPEDLPLVLADAGLLERVLVNLIDNAMRHGAGAVSISATAGSQTAKLAVIDHGPGVAPEQREHLFEPFQRLNDSSAQGGAGLGLTVARGFTEAMGGALVADGSSGGGLTMRLRIPLAR